MSGPAPDNVELSSLPLRDHPPSSLVQPHPVRNVNSRPNNAVEDSDARSLHKSMTFGADNIETDGKGRIGLADLQASWAMYFLRFFDAWIFFIATTVLAGYGLNSFLSMFLQFTTQLANNKRLLEPKDVMDLIRLGTRTCLLVLLWAGAVQRGIWLLMDCFTKDIFLNFRRVLCLEGVGPGEWFDQTLRITVADEMDRAEILECLDFGEAAGKVTQDMTIGTVQVFRGWEILPNEVINSDDELENEITNMVLPAELVFSTPSRSIRTASLEGSDVFGHRRAVWDMICQITLHFSLNVLPVMTVLARLGWGSLLSGDFVGALASKSIQVAFFHIAVYFIFSTAVDYYWKFLAMVALEEDFGVKLMWLPDFMQRWKNRLAHGNITTSPTASPSRDGDRLGFEPPEDDEFAGGTDSFENETRGGATSAAGSAAVGTASFTGAGGLSISVDSPAGARSTPALLITPALSTSSTHSISNMGSDGLNKTRSRMRMEAVKDKHAAVTLGVIEAAPSRVSSRSDDLNVLVVVRRLLTEDRTHLILVIFGVSCVLLYLLIGAISGWIGPWRVSLLLVSFGCFGLIFRFRFARSLYKKGSMSSLAELYRAQQRKPYSVRTKCFQRNCGVDPQSMLTSSGWLLCGAMIFSLCGLIKGVTGIAVLGLIMGLWNLVAMISSCCFRHHLWIVSMFQTLIFGLLAFFSALIMRPADLLGAGYDSTIILMLLTQLGKWRLARSKTFVALQAFFISAAVIIAAVTLFANSSKDGGVFGRGFLEGCYDEEIEAGTCHEIKMPADGSGLKTPYAFCGLSWPMGGPDDTVSDKCNDDHLSVVDFGQLAGLAGFAENLTLAELAINQNLPGWEVMYSQMYNIEKNHFNTFMHLRRGKTDVIAVRGTSSAIEALQDINLWMPVAFIQIAHSLGPSFYSTRNILRVLTDNSRQYRSAVLENIVTYVTALKAKNKNSNNGHTIYLTGHSLGGGLAAAVGTALDIPAITFSAPGLKSTSAILRPRGTNGDLIRRSVNVVPDRDIVPKVDEQTGTILTLKCSLSNPGFCHKLSVTWCELWISCGDGAGRGIPRDYRRACSVCKSQAGLGEYLGGRCPDEENAAAADDDDEEDQVLVV